jgi:hypothetical protein
MTQEHRMFMHMHSHFVYNLLPLYHRTVLHYDSHYMSLYFILVHQYIAMLYFHQHLGKHLQIMYLLYTMYLHHNYLYSMHISFNLLYHILHLIVLLHHMSLLHLHLLLHMSTNYFLKYLGMLDSKE